MAYKVSLELDQLLEALVGSKKQLIYDQIDKPLPHTIRFNPLKGKISALQKLLTEQGFRFETVGGFDNAFRINYQPYPIGKSLSHYLGHIYVQDIASMLPPLVLDPKPGEWVLDMSAAPGSKTTQIATLMNNKGVIFANDIVMKRVRSLASNLERLGIVNTAIFKLFGEQIGNHYFETFHRVLLDPACTGLGTLHKSPEVLSWWTPHHCERMASGQKSLIASAVRALRPGGVLCYSTCTLTPEENEEVIDYALREFPVELEPMIIKGLDLRSGLTAFKDRRYDPSLIKACRVYPFHNDTEGFFIAKLRKAGTMKKNAPKKFRNQIRIPFLSAKTSPVKKYLDFLGEHFQIPGKAFLEFIYLMQQGIVFADRELQNFPFYHRPVQCGLVAGRQMTHGAKLTTGGVHLVGHFARQNVFEISRLGELERFVNRESTGIKLDKKGQVIVKYRDCAIGYGLGDNDTLKSQFPKGNWPFKLLTSDK